MVDFRAHVADPEVVKDQETRLRVQATVGAVTLPSICERIAVARGGALVVRIEDTEQLNLASQTVKQRLAALRTMFDSS